MNTNMFTDSTPINCATKHVASAVCEQELLKFPNIPANKCAGTAPTTSSIFIENTVI